MSVTADPEVLQGWRSGPRWYYAIAAMIESPAVEQRRRAVADVLGDLLHFTTPDQPHVTLWALGFEPVEWAERTIHVAVGPPDTFASAPYLRVDGNQIAALRQDIRLAAKAAKPGADPQSGAEQGRRGPFTPHVTVGTYRRVVPLQQVRRRIAAVPCDAPIIVAAQVRLVAVDTRSPVGALHPVRQCRMPPV